MILKTIDEMEEYLEDFNWYKFSIDTETTSLKLYEQELVGISLCDGKKACYLPLGHAVKTVSGEEYNKDNLPFEEVINYLKGRAVRKAGGKKQLTIMHNAVFDSKALKKWGVNLYNNEWFDTLVAAHLLDENRKSKSLKALVVDLWDDDYGIETKGIKYLSINKAGEYAIKDAEYTYKLFEKYSEGLKEQELEMLFRKIEMPFLRVIQEMEEQGFDIDVPHMNRTTIDLEEAIIKFEEEMYTTLEEPYNLQMNLFGEVVGVKGKYDFNSPQQVVKILQDLGLEIKYLTPKGNPSAGRKTIDSLKEKHPFVKILNKYKIAQKLLSGFFKPMPTFIDGDGRVRASFRDTGTATGRLSCQQPNLQQLPSSNSDFPVETRACFKASEGYTMVTADFSGQELRLLAHVADDEAMIQAFKEGRDFHQEVAENMGVTRKKAKIFNFSLAYGKTTKGLAEDWGMTEEEAEELVEKHYEKYPQVKEAMKQCTRDVYKQGYVTNMFGRRRRFNKVNGEYYPKKVFRQAFNFLIQGAAADMSRIAGIKVLQLKHRKKDWGVRILAMVHDEICIEVKSEFLEECLPEIKKCMVESVNLKVPVLADVNYGNDYSEAK